MSALIIGVVLFLIYSLYEYRQHHIFRRQIPIIIHINGTRGKSSVTRLIAAGLRAGGKKVLAKTTGSAPRLIFEDGSEIPIIRYFGANIKEQLKIIKYAAKRKTDILVLECMAVTPEYQWVNEHQMVQSDIGVITNSRLDHLDLMGPGIRNVTLSLCNTIPQNGVVYTSEKEMFLLMAKEAKKNHSKLEFVDSKDITDEEINRFSFIEHKENVALALDICEYCGIDREKALEGMWEANPDIGATEIFEVHHKSQKIFFAHSFAANDPESTEFLIKNISDMHSHLDSVVILLSTRADRLFRSKQLIEMLSAMKFDYLILIGEQTQTMRSYALSHDIDADKISDIGWVDGSKLVKEIERLNKQEILLFGIGNIGGNGGIVLQYFKERNKKNV